MDHGPIMNEKINSIKQEDRNTIIDQIVNELENAPNDKNRLKNIRQWLTASQKVLNLNLNPIKIDDVDDIRSYLNQENEDIRERIGRRSAHHGRRPARPRMNNNNNEHRSRSRSPVLRRSRSRSRSPPRRRHSGPVPQFNLDATPSPSRGGKTFKKHMRRKRRHTKRR